MYTLGIETSCDDTSVALVKNTGEVLDLQKWTADEDHVHFGGIIPERASRNHLKTLVPLIEKILDKNNLTVQELEGIAVTSRPGLVGSLIVGVVTAQTLSLAFDKPLVSVNHLEGHMYSPWLVDEGEPLKEGLNIFPQLCLIVSGGHTQIVLIKSFGENYLLGATRDDAAGEALDKFSNILGMGFPGGPKVDAQSKKGDPFKYKFPLPMIKDPGYTFSFSGLKAAGARMVEGMGPENLTEEMIQDLCASYLHSATEVLSIKLKKAIQEHKPKLFTVVGGVSANSMLRDKLENLSEELDVHFLKPSLKYCTDNGAMIGLAGALRLKNKDSDNATFIKPSARSIKGDFL